VSNQPEAVVVTHDESIFRTNDGKKKVWIKKGQSRLLPKSPGKSLMVSGFVCPCHGFISKKIVTIEKDGYWTNQNLVEQLVNDTIPEFKKLHKDKEEQVGLFLFDNSSNHRMKNPQSRNVNSFILSDGGKNVPKGIRPGYYTDPENGTEITQSFYYANGDAKGIHTILQERNLWDDRYKLADAKNVLSQQKDFIEDNKTSTG